MINKGFARILSLQFLFLCSCGGGSGPEKSQSSTPPPYQIDFLSRSGNNIYFNVTGFDAKNATHYEYMLQKATKEAKNETPPFTIHYLDNLPAFQPPQSGGGMYGGESIRKKVILQYIVITGGQVMTSFDPLGYGVYQQPE